VTHGGAVLSNDHSAAMNRRANRRTCSWLASTIVDANRTDCDSIRATRDMAEAEVEEEEGDASAINSPYSTSDLIELSNDEGEENPKELLISDILADPSKILTRSSPTLQLTCLRLITNRSDFALVMSNPISIIVRPYRGMSVRNHS
jgi:hypothetical protein